MIKNFVTIFICVVMFSLPVFGQEPYRQVSNGSITWSVVDDSTYTGTINFWSDLTGNGFFPTQILQDSFLVITSTNKRYRISVASGLTLSQATLTIVERGGDWGAPTFGSQIQVYNPLGKVAIPAAVQGNSGATAQMMQAIVSYNASVTGSGTGGGTGDVTGPGTSTDNAIATFDGTGNTIQSSPATVDDLGNIGTPGTVDGRDLSVDGAKLDGIEGGSTADQSDAEIETAYNNIVSVVSQVEAEAGTSTTVRRWTAERVRQAVAAAAKPPDSSFVSGDSIYLAFGANNFFVGMVSNVFTPEQFGAVGDGVTDDTDALNAAIVQAQVFPKGIIQLKPGAVYLISDELNYQNANSEFTVIGYGATIKRCDAITTTLSSAATSASTFIVVNDTGNFSVGQDVGVLDGTATYGGQGHAEVSIFPEITSISNDTIYLSAALSGPTNYAIGSTVFRSFDMLRETRVSVYGVTFDGNRNNQVNFGWTHSQTIDKLEPGSVVQNCRFINIPNENIFYEVGVLITGNYADSLNGSFAHCTSSPYDLQGRNVLSNNIISNASLVDRAIAGHNEAVFTCSAHTDTLIVSNNIVINSTNGFFGASNSSDDNVISITGNIVINCKSAVEIQVRTADPNPPVAEPGFTVSDNIFYNCGGIIETGTGPNATLVFGESIVGMIITDNALINTHIRLEGTTDAIISGNYMRFDSSYVQLSSWVPQPLHAIGLFYDSGTKITNNTIYNDKYSSVGIVTAIRYGSDTSPALLSDGYHTRYGRMHIADNVIAGFECAIDEGTNSTSPASYSYFGTVIENNILYQKDTTAFSKFYFCRARPGVTFRNNTLFCDTEVLRCLQVEGVSSAAAAAINGPLVTGNTIVGSAESIQLGQTAGTGYNSVIMYNFLGGTIDERDAAAQGNKVLNNIQLPVNEVVPLDFIGIRRNIN